MATENRDFRVKNGLVVEGSSATVNGNNILTTASSLDSLGDVVITSATTDQVLKFNGTNWINATDATGGGGGDLNGLSDVVITSITDNEILQYDLGTSSWINQTITEAGLVAGVGTNKISYQTTEPSTPATGDIWIDSDGDADIQEQTITIALSDELSVLTTGNGKVYWRAPFAMTLTQIPRASLTTASSSGVVTVDINEGSTSVLGANKLSIDANELTSTTAVTATTLADTSIADDAQIRFDIDAAGTNATGLKVTLYYRKT